jgi:hypothetical protein
MYVAADGFLIFQEVYYPMLTSEYDRDLAVVIVHLTEKLTSQSSDGVTMTLGRQV